MNSASHKPIRHPECKCHPPCRQFVCPECVKWRPWCCGGAPDPRCDHCVTKPLIRPGQRGLAS